MKKKRIGIVVSTKMNKTIVVAVQTRYPHPKYKKFITKTKKYMTHDEINTSQLGDIVLIEESIPLSRHKKWILKKILQSKIIEKK